MLFLSETVRTEDIDGGEGVSNSTGSSNRSSSSRTTAELHRARVAETCSRQSSAEAAADAADSAAVRSDPPPPV
jgi:hypothetical protein